MPVDGELRSPTANESQPTVPRERISPWTDIAASMLLCTLFLVTWALGPAPTFTYGHDLFAALDAGWRVNCGQRPHVDFYSPYGAAVPLLVGIGIHLAHETAAGIGVASAIAGLACALLGYGIARRRLPPVAAVVFTVFVFLLTSAPSAINEIVPSNGMYYTRWSYGLLAVLLLECLTSSGFGEGVIAGAVLGLLFFVKLNMFLLGAMLLLPSLVLAWKRARVQGIAVGATLVSLAMLLYLKFQLFSIWHDYQIMVRARSGSVTASLVWSIAKTHLSVLALLLLLATTVSLCKKQGKSRLLLPLMTIAAYLADVLSMATNAQWPGVPLSALCVLYCAAQLTELVPFYFRRPSPRIAASVATGILVLFASIWFVELRWTDAEAFYWACRVKCDKRNCPSGKTV